MKLMLDTNTCIALIKRKPIHILQKFSEYQVGDIGISAVTLAKLRYGVSKSQHQAKSQAALNEAQRSPRKAIGLLSASTQPTNLRKLA
jgi:tRNA(fMet)-specific endonuclease VapC